MKESRLLGRRTSGYRNAVAQTVQPHEDGDHRPRSRRKQPQAAVSVMAGRRRDGPALAR